MKTQGKARAAIAVAALPGILARMQQCGEQLSSQVTLEVRQKTGEQINEI